MKVIPFNIKYRPEIESGEMKVVNGKGKPVTILKWDMQGRFPILGVAMTEQTNYEGDESWEEERPFAYSAEGFPSPYVPANKTELHLLIEGDDRYTLEGILEEMLDYAKNHAKPDADVAKIFRDRVYDFVKMDVLADGYGEAEQDLKEKINVGFNEGIWYAIDFLVRWNDDPTAAVQILNAANISRKQARELWLKSDLEDKEGRMMHFLNEDNFERED